MMQGTVLLALCLVEGFVTSVNGETDMRSAATEAVTRGPNRPPSDDVTPLRVVGLFGSSGLYPAGNAFRYAAELAEEDINQRVDVLPGYRLMLEAVNTECNIATGMDVLYRKLYAENTTKIMVLGGTCSHVTEHTAEAARKYNLVQISYSALSPRLSDQTLFPWFFRPLAPESDLSEVCVLLLRRFNWTTISMVQGAQGLFSSTVESMAVKLKNNNITLNGTQPFEHDSPRVIENLQKQDARIIFFSSYEDVARKAICAAFKLKFYGPKIVWIFPGFYDLAWYDKGDVNCTTEELLQVLDGYFAVSNVYLASEDSADMVGTTRRDYQERFQAKSLQDFRRQTSVDRKVKLEDLRRGEDRAPMGYDTLWAIALALNATLTDYLANGSAQDVLKTFSYRPGDPMGERIFRRMRDTQFRGLSGNVSFTATGDRIPQIAVKQFRVTPGGEADMHVVGLYTNSEMKWIPNAIRWKGGRIPDASRRMEHVLKPLPWPMYVATCLSAGVGVLLSVALLFFNIRNRAVRLIRMSSPNINNITLVGCVLTYLTVTVQDVQGQRLDYLCHVRLYLIVLGFSMVYGSLFAKTWRVYKIMMASRRFAKVSKDLRDRRLMLTVLVLAAVNLSLLVVWTAVDPLKMTPVDIENSDTLREDDWLEVQQALVCQSTYKTHFTLVIIALQALLIFFGAFLAFQTRQVTIPELNDSRWVAMCIYNALVLGSLGVILSLGTKQLPHIAYVLESALIIVGTTLSQCLIFVPKLLSYKTLKHGRQDSRQNVFTVKTVCFEAGSSASTRSGDDTRPDISSTTDPCSSSSSFPIKAIGEVGKSLSMSSTSTEAIKRVDKSVSLLSSPTKAIRRVRNSLSAVLRRYCSIGADQEGT